MNEELIAKAIIKTCGTETNIISASNCMTRLRLKLNDYSVADNDNLKKITGVLGINKTDTELQIILGPGKAAKITGKVNELLSVKPEVSFSSDADELHQKIKAQNATPIKMFFKHIADIFIPLIPAFIACGLINGINNIITNLSPGLAALPEMKLFAVMGQAVFSILTILVGFNAVKEFGGTPVIGALIAAFISAPALKTISPFDLTLVPGRGGIIAVLLIAAFAAFLEKRLHQIMPSLVDFFLTPLLTFAVSSFLAIILFQPVGGLISNFIGEAANGLVKGGGAVAGFFMAGSFLPLVMLGMHHVLTPIHAELIAKTGVTILLPILAMAGAGQIGAAIAVFLKTKNPLLKKTILTGLPIAFMGIGEPLIYGVTLPLLRPFIGACIGAAFGGAIEAFFIVGSNTIGISGLPLTAAVDKPLIYLVGTITAYITAFLATYIIGFNDPQQNIDKE